MHWRDPGTKAVLLASSANIYGNAAVEIIGEFRPPNLPTTTPSAN
jgi:hypothetical protein